MVTRYGEPDFGRQGGCCFRRGEQAEHRMGDRKGLGWGRGERPPKLLNSIWFKAGAVTF
jgi:hypothetical protein